MKPIEWRSLGLTLALAAVAAGCGKDSNDPDPEGNNQAPTAAFSYSCGDLTCSFTDLSADSDGQITSYDWDFGGEGVSSQKNPTYTFSSEGAVEVTLTVVDDVGAEDAVAKQVTLTLPVAGGPTADFSVTCSSLDCTFHDLSTDPDGPVVAWAWEFGDGAQSEVQHPIHHYTATARKLYTTRLTVTDNAGLTSTKTTEFSVSPAATLQCESAPGTGQFASCSLELLDDATVTVVLESRSCDAQGNTFQITAPVPETLYLSLISGRNADMLIGQHVISAPVVKQSGLEVLSTGYMVVDGGAPTTVSYISNANPLPADKKEIAMCTAMAGEMLGMKLIYMDAGSGARHAISEDMIREVAHVIEVPLIIGGGIVEPEKAYLNCKAGADVIVVGNAIEKDPNLIKEMAAAVHSVAVKV
jgi:phosphoglycerol geranylgeranyltransferase